MSNTLTTAVILAGGKGTRLAPVAKDTPKALVHIGGLSVVEHQIALLKQHGIRTVWLLLGHLGKEVQEFLEAKDLGVELRYKQEQEALGTAGALSQLQNEIKEDFLVLSGDVMMNVDCTRFWNWHAEKNSIVSLLVHPNDHPFDSDLVEVNTEGKVVSLLKRPHKKGETFRNISIASLYICSPKIFSYIAKNGKSDFEKDLLPVLIKASQSIYAYKSPEYIKDMGTPERLEQVRKDYESGKIQRMSLRNERRAIFLDRDGVLNEEIDQLSRAEDLRVYAFAPEAVRSINETDFMAIIVSNQPMIAKGFMTEHEAEEIQKKLETELGWQGAKIDGAYYCPHHPEKGFPGERPELKIDCECRKPKSGLFLRAKEEFHINLQKSYMIGDQTADIAAGKDAGCKTVLVETGYAGKDGKYEAQPDYVAKHILQAVERILSVS